MGKLTDSCNLKMINPRLSKEWHPTKNDNLTPKDFTPGCTTEADEFAKDYKKFQNKGIEVIGVSPDDVDSHRKFCDKMGIKFPLLADVDKEISQKFGVWGKKKFMGREYMGVMRSTFLVDDKGTIFKIYPKVKPAGHSKQVLEDFSNLN